MTPTTTEADPVTDRPRFTLSRAAELTGSSHSTTKRRLKAGAFPGATLDDVGAWTVSPEDLLAAGFVLRTGAPVTTPAQENVTPDPDPGLVAEVAELRRLLAIEQVRREAAEQIAAEREKRAQTAERALLMLEQAAGGPSNIAIPETSPTHAADQPASANRSGRFRRWLRG